MDINAFEQAEAGCEIAQQLSKSMKLHEEHSVLIGDERSSLEKIRTRLENICVQKNERMAAMPYQDRVKLWDQRNERTKLKWYRDERQAGKPEPPTLFRAVKDYHAVENHLAGTLWFRSLPYFRNIKSRYRLLGCPFLTWFQSLPYFRKIKGVRADPLEGIGSYESPDEKICRDLGDENPGAFILSFGEQAESLQKFGEYCLEVRHPLELKRRVEDRLCPGSRVEWGKVQYNKVMQLEADPSPAEDRIRTYYSKPEKFADEQEWRLVIFLPMRLLNETLELHVGRLLDVFDLVDLRG